METLKKSWTFEMAAKEAKKYSTRTAFAKGCGKAYNFALRKGFLETICAHMVVGKLPNGYWNVERISEEAKKYPTRTSFKEGSLSAHAAARKLGILDELFPKKGT